jgi:ribosomal protein L39E
VFAAQNCDLSRGTLINCWSQRVCALAPHLLFFKLCKVCGSQHSNRALKTATRSNFSDSEQTDAPAAQPAAINLRIPAFANLLTRVLESQNALRRHWARRRTLK